MHFVTSPLDHLVDCTVNILVIMAHIETGEVGRRGHNVPFPMECRCYTST